MTDVLDSALAYAFKGLRVLPLHNVAANGGCSCGNRLCESVAKHPLTRHGVKEATTDEATIREWWRQWPVANVGIATGEIVALDVDVKKGTPGEQSLAALVAEIGELPDTAESRTPSGGRHVLFAAAGAHVGNSASRLAPGLDIRGHGGYIVAPPSRTPAGDYTWGFFSSLLDTPLADLPPALAAKCGTNGANGTNGARPVADPLPDVIHEGQGRNSYLFSLASGDRRRGLGKDEILERLSAVNDRRCVPPLGLAELVNIANSAMRYKPTDDAHTTKAAPKDKPAPETPPARTPPRDAADLLDKDLPPLRWLIEDLLPEGLTILAGRPKMGKSWMALGWLVALALGGAVLGKIRVAPAESLYLALEDNERRLQDRLRTVLNGARLPRGVFHYEFTWKAMGAGGLELLRDWLDEHPECRIVVIDTLARVRMSEDGKNVSGYMADYRAMTGLQRLALSRRIAIVMIHHLNQGDSEDPLHLISGTSGLTGAADGAIVLKRQRGEADAVLFGTHRDMKDNFELALSWDRDLASWAIIGEAAEYALSKQRRQIISILRELGALSPNEISDMTGISYASVRKLVAAMFKEGQLRQTSHGKYEVPDVR